MGTFDFELSQVNFFREYLPNFPPTLQLRLFRVAVQLKITQFNRNVAY